MKKNMTKRVPALLLALLMLVTLIPVTAMAEGSVAEVGGVEYETLLDAVNAAEEGQTIHLLTDFEVASGSYIEYNMPKDSIFDLGGNTLTVPFTAAVFQGENITIQNGRFESRADYSIWIGDGDPTTATLNNISSNGGVNVFAATATLVDCDIDVTDKAYYAVWADSGYAVVNIISGSYTAEGEGRFVLNSCAGVNNDGSITPAQINVQGGSFTGKVTVQKKGDSQGEIVIQSGTFNKDVSEYLAEDVKQDAQGNIVPADAEVAPFGAVAAINGEYFASLHDAIRAANDGDVVEVWADVALDGSINPHKDVTIRGMGEPKPKISSPSGIFSVTTASTAIENLTLEVKNDKGWYIYHSATDETGTVQLTVKDCDIVMGEGVTYVGNIVMTEGVKTNTPVIFTGNHMTATSRVALAGPGDGSQITDNYFDFMAETCPDGRTSCIGLTATADSSQVIITGNTFKNANRVLAVDHAQIPADKLTYRDNKFINCRWAFEMEEDDDRAFDLSCNYYQFGDEAPCAPKIENANGSAGHTNPGNELTTAAVNNGVYYTTEDLAAGAKITLSETAVSLFPNSELTLTAKVEGIDGADLVWTSSAPAVATVENGVVTVISSGSAVITAAVGEVTASCTVTVRSNSSIVISSENKFAQPDTEIKDDDVPLAIAPMSFADVAAAHWYHDAVKYVYEKGLMSGTDSSRFSPDVSTTRGMIVSILYRLDGQPEAGRSQFTDVSANAYYAKAVAWAAENGIISGYDAKTFGPNDNITREQLAAILRRYAGFKGYDVARSTELNTFADADQVSGYAVDPMKWAVAAELISGVTETTLNAQGNATRAQLASILFRFCESIAK